MTRFHIFKRLWRYSLWALLTFLLLVSAFLWYITTESFQRMVRQRLTASIEQATGGRVELGSFHVVPLRFQVEIRNLTIHGRELATERSLAHVDSISAVIDLPAVLGWRMSFRSLVLTHPVVHVIYYRDGTTNQPVPKQASGADFDRMFSISAHQLKVRNGEVFIQEQRLPLDFVANEVEAEFDYSFLHRRYSGDISIGKGETQFAGYRPIAWSAKMDFSISHDEIQLRSFEAISEGSELRGGGTITDFRNPVFKGTYDLVLDLEQAAAVMRQPRTASGRLQMAGFASWSSQSHSLGGGFDMKNVAVNAGGFNVKNMTATGKLLLDPQKIAVTQVQGRALRGAFSGDLEVLNWNSPEKTLPSAKQSPQRGNATIKVKDVSLSELLASLGRQYRDLKIVPLAGVLSGSTEIRWKDSMRNAEASSTVSVVRPARVAAGELPLTASAHFSYQARPSILEIADLSASTPATQIRASGTLAASNSLRLSVASDHLGEWAPLISAVFPDGLPVAVSGHAAFNGTVGGNDANPVLSGNLQLHDFDTTASPGGGQRKVVHWDALNADLQVSPSNLVVRNALFRRADSSLRLDGSAGLYDWKTGPASTIHGNAEAQNFDAHDLEMLAGQDVGARGKINARLEISGTISKLLGQGTVTWSNGSIHGYGFDSAGGAMALANNRVSVRSLAIARGHSRVTGTGWYDLSTSAFEGDVTGTNFEIAELAPLEQSRVKLAGTLDFSAKASGTVDSPDLSAHIQMKNVAFNDEAAGDYLIDAATHGPDLHLTGHSEFGKSELLIEGNVQLREQWPARISFHFTRLDIDSFLVTYIHGRVTGHSAVAGDLVLQGPLRDPSKLTLTGNLTDLYADVAKVKLKNEGPVRFAIDHQTLTINSLHLTGDNTDVSATGSMQLSGDHQLNLESSGKVGLQLLQTYDPDLTGSGTVTGQVSVTGTMGSPVVRGALQVENGSIYDVNLPSALSELNGKLQFNQNQVTIEKLTGRTGGGTMSFAGHAQLNGKVLSFDLTANADSVRLRYPPGVSSTATAQLRWSGSSNGSLLSGDITVIKLGVTPGFDFGAYLARSTQSSGLPQTDPVLNNIRLDLHVVTTPDLQMQTSVLRLRGDADLKVRGNAAKPVLLGRADVFEGEAYFNGTKYRLERGGVTFGTPASSNAAASVPVVDFEATTHVRDYDITLSVTGPADHPKMNYRSEPPLPTNDIIGLLAFGQTTEESGRLQQSSQSAFSPEASNAMLAAALNATLNNRTQRIFGNSRIKIDPQGLETETSPTQTGPALTIEQQVKDNLTLTYTTNVAQTSQQVIRAEYYVSRNVSVVAIRDQNGVVSFDVKIRRRKR